VITGGILYLHRQGRLLPSDEFIENIEEISAQTDRITSIIKHLRSFIRRGESNLVPCSVNDAIDQALGVVGKKLDAHGVTLHMQMDPSLPLVLAHPMGLEEVVVNLLVNAMEALDTMEKADKQITVKTQFADSVILEISDNGPGIDPQMRETIFDSFISSKVDCENMGLGLAIVKNIVTSYLGTIQLVADSTEGVAFKIELPLIQDGSEGKN